MLVHLRVIKREHGNKPYKTITNANTRVILDH